MLSTEQLLTYAQWSGYATIAFAALAGLAWVLQWGIRFRLVGVTGFMGVLTVGIFGLGLGLYNRVAVPDAVPFVRVFDTGANQVVITVPTTITETQLAATLKQAALDTYSPGRVARGNDTMTVRARAVIHPKPGVTELVYLGQVERSLALRDDANMQITVDPQKLAQLSKFTA